MLLVVKPGILKEKMRLFLLNGVFLKRKGVFRGLNRGFLKRKCDFRDK